MIIRVSINNTEYGKNGPHKFVGYRKSAATFFWDMPYSSKTSLVIMRVKLHI
jgi:hypothetical protein